MSKQKINDNKTAIWLEQVCPMNSISSMSHGDQLETFHLTVCHILISHYNGWSSLYKNNTKKVIPSFFGMKLSGSFRS